MKEIIFVTSNKGKFETASRVLRKYGIRIIQKEAEFIEPREHEPKKVTEEKIIQIKKMFDRPLIVMNAGLFIPSLNNFPGTFSNFILQTIGVDGLLKLLKGKDKSCEFRECLAYWEPGLDEPIYFEKHISGIIADKPKGKLQSHHWSALSLIFIPEGFSQTLGEISEEEYSILAENISIFKKFAEWLSKRVTK